MFGLVEAGSAGWASGVTMVSLVGGVLLLAGFVQNERRAEEPILPLALLAHTGRSTANLARGLVYAGMYGMFFFLSQFLQDVQGYSPLRTGVGFLPIPVTVFLASQLTGRVLVRHVPAKVLMLSGISLTTLSLVLSSRLHVGASYGQVVVDLVLLGAGTGISLVSLTSASLAGVEPKHAGAASGLVNVTQQVGAALGAGGAGDGVRGRDQARSTGCSRCFAVAGGTQSTLVHGLDDVFGLAALFALMALVLVAVMVRPEAGRLRCRRRLWRRRWTCGRWRCARPSTCRPAGEARPRWRLCPSRRAADALPVPSVDSAFFAQGGLGDRGPLGAPGGQAHGLGGAASSTQNSFPSGSRSTYQPSPV